MHLSKHLALLMLSIAKGGNMIRIQAVRQMQQPE